MPIIHLRSFAFLALILGFGILLFPQTSPHFSARAPASNKARTFLPAQLHVSKANQMIDVSLEPIAGFPAENSQVAHVRARIFLQRKLDGPVNLEWKLPAGAELVSGQTRELVNLLPGQSITRDLAITGFSSEGNRRNLVLDVNGISQGVAVGNSAVFSSHPTRSDLSLAFRSSKSGRPLSPQAQTKLEEDGNEESVPEEPQQRTGPPRGIRF